MTGDRSLSEFEKLDKLLIKLRPTMLYDDVGVRLGSSCRKYSTHPDHLKHLFHTPFDLHKGQFLETIQAEALHAK